MVPQQHRTMIGPAAGPLDKLLVSPHAGLKAEFDRKLPFKMAYWLVMADSCNPY